MTKDQIAELITRRRRQILIHSIIYYRMDDNLVSDHTWQEWANELEKLQVKYPDIAAECPYAEAYKDFDGSSGYNLPLEDPWATRKAIYLLGLRDQGYKGKGE